MLLIKIDEVDNGYIVSVLPDEQGFRYTSQHVATDISSLGLLLKQLAGAEKDKQCKAKRNQ